MTMTLITEMRKLKDEMSDVRAALRQQLNLVADRLASLEEMRDNDHIRRLTHERNKAIEELATLKRKCVKKVRHR
jgi:hypothetical protein